MLYYQLIFFSRRQIVINDLSNKKTHMKNVLNRKAPIIITAAFLLSICVSPGCKKDDAPPAVDHDYTLGGNASSAQEVPTNTSTATGSITGTYNDETNILNYSITWTGLTGTANAAHFHGPALPGVSAGVIIPFTITNNAATGNLSGTATLTEAQEVDMLAGKWYYNVHTTANPGGEIRGQLIATK